MKDILELLSFVAFLLLIGALIFGVSCDGTKYKLTCNQQDGVGIKETPTK